MAQVSTIHGMMDESVLEKMESSQENEDNTVKATEYWLSGELVHRSVHVILKNGVDLLGQAAVLA